MTVRPIVRYPDPRLAIPARPVTEFDDALREMIARGGAVAVEAAMPDEWIDWFAAAGDPDRCVEKIHALMQAGSTSVVLTLMDPQTVRESLELLAKHVLPRI